MAIAIAGKTIATPRAKQKRNYWPIYKNDTINEVKRLREITFAIAKLEERKLYRELYWIKEQFDSTPKIVPYFGCTNNSMAYYMMHILGTNLGEIQVFWWNIISINLRAYTIHSIYIYVDNNQKYSI